MPYSENLRLSRIWNSMMRRCYNPIDIGYSLYGGRGIGVCKLWRKRDPFIEWALCNGYDTSFTLDRKNNNKGYSPSNCKFSTRREQARNRRSNVLLRAFNETKSVVEWTEDPRCPVDAVVLHERARKGGTDHEKMITTPSGKYQKQVRQDPMYTAHGKTQTMKAWEKECGVKRTTILERVRLRGYSFEEALDLSKH